MRKFFIALVVSISLISCDSNSAAPTKEKEPILEGNINKNTIETDSSISLLFAGDLLLDRGVRKEIERSGLDFLFDHVRSLISEHDFFIVNLETPVTKIESPLNKKYIFRSEPENLPILKKNGITHAILSNNHSMDQSKTGLYDTKLNLDKNEIVSIGYGKNTNEACAPIIIQKNQKTIAIFGSVQVPIENWFPLENDHTICQMSAEEMCPLIQAYKEKNPKHIVIATLHWGIEYQKNPSPNQRFAAQNLINAGTDLIIGHHPHVIQDIEEYKGKKIYYSIGNFIFDSTHPLAKKGLLVSITLGTDGKLESHGIPFTINQCKPEIQ